ncbi:MAG: hypothetical protein LBU27_06520 [Candidatus Peribacteria bacterium]|jgi:hypothetical protein|nr:hypothetical protein [Candidatus Peribacteria bacterium]
MYHLRAVNTSSSTANAGKSSNVGSGALSNNMPPFYVVEYYIKVKNQNTTTSVSDTYYRYEGSYGGCS